MYTKNEKKTLSKATIKLLRKCIKDIQNDETNTPSTLLKLGRFTSIVFNDQERCRNLMTLITASMWGVFDKEVRK